ncbi:flagellar protein [Vibrio sp. HA2012]|uniref:flagellar basal body-associated FliL family protein n=1 Tax=Vibrio sp. HA2012 TaxID=1971595 RepID=UPI000C2B83E8|nr:flagellar basal body-associated FliL family protein [Vibrio sp. HA2012]PJC86425.1 flagellar protein [Vibrio sp. HA2012]
MSKRTTIVLCIFMLLSSILVSAGTVVLTSSYLQNPDGFASLSFVPDMLSGSEKPEEKPTFHSLEKLVLGVKGKRQTHFIMLEIAVETRQPKHIEDIDSYMPVVRNALLKMFSNKTYEELQEQKEIDSLQNEVKSTLLTAFANTHFVRDIDDVILTKYVIQ